MCRRQLRETASLTGERNLVLYLDAEGVVEAAKGDGAEIDPEIAWLIQRRDRLARIRNELNARWSEDPGRDALRLQGAAAGQFGMLSYVVVPLAAREGVRGFVGIFNAPGRPLPETGDVRLVECLSRQLSSSATTHDLVIELKDVLFNTVRALVATIDAKDPYTRGHSERVYKLSTAIGEAMGLPADELQILAWSALLHDIGKIAIPNEILRKPGRLTPHEYEVIKTHPERGCRVIEEIPQFRGALDGIRHHHERFDGKGYPAGLAGHDIPLMGRIIGVADTYDAMVTSRAYRSARSMEAAVQEIKASSGTQLDPDIVEIFVQLVALGRVVQPDEDTTERQAA
jgi:HD-GYP domain-containing protein (c-di-GMP phosphodiesterase class II)